MARKRAKTQRPGVPKKDWQGPYSRLQDPKFVKAFCAVLRDGCYAKTACRLNGVPEGTYLSWLRRADRVIEECWPTTDGDETSDGFEPSEMDAPFVAFRLAIDKASAEAERETVKQMRAAAKDKGKGDWRAAEAWLRRRFPHWSDAATQGTEGTTTVVHVHTGIPGVDDE